MQTKVLNKTSLIQQLSGRNAEIKKFGVRSLSIFGSFAKDTNIHAESDVDFLVDFEPEKKTYDNFINLSFYLEDLLGRKVELVTPQSLSKYIGPGILKEAESVASNLELLHHMQDEIAFVLQSTANKEKETVINDPILCRAIVRSLEIIGEAATKVSDEFKAAHPYIEWKKMAGTRNRLIHDYFGVDYDIVWNIIQTKLPDLQENIADILNS